MSAATVLIIDDDRLIRWSLSTLLERAGYRICQATTGAEGLAAIQTNMPDVVLLDITLPDMDGFAVLQTVRQAHPNLPILTMTADATPEKARQAFRLGALGHLEKPCESATLLAAISEALKSNLPPRQVS